MFFTDEFLAQLKNDPISGVIQLVDHAYANLDDFEDRWSEENYEVLLEAYALASAIVQSQHIQCLGLADPFPFGLSDNLDTNYNDIMRYLNDLQARCKSKLYDLKLNSYETRFRAVLGLGFSYEFSQGDLQRVQLLINQLRDLISQVDGLEKDHQQRLLVRLEKLQSELHKKVSDLDRFWGLIGDAGVVMAKIGSNAKPIVDRIKEIADIVWQTQSRAEELPSGTEIPMLSNKTTRADKEE